MEQYIEFIGNHLLLVIGFAVILGLLVMSLVNPLLRGYQVASPTDATQLINREDALVLDIRDDNEYSNGHIVNSVHIPLSYLNDRLPELEKYKGKPIIVGCRSGSRSSQACATLHKQGFQPVYNLSGGIMAWQNASLPLVKK